MNILEINGQTKNSLKRNRSYKADEIYILEIKNKCQNKNFIGWAQ